MADDTAFETRAFPSAADFDAWLAAEHDRAPGLFVKIAKKSAGIPSLTAAEAVEVALCHGWIDGRGNRVDDDWFTVRYTPRRAKSVWSQKNVETVARLVADGRMRPAGLAAVEAAQADGRWDRAYAGSATITVPDDLAAALAAEPAAESFFAGLDKTNRYAVLWRVHTAATPQTRAKRIAACVQMLAEGRRFHQ
ncbi:YdeI/OmpD-associated family protein [Modestobacter excelsi]|uniref:YdeI/OmpD-associated family protein n=1 Tax=Modestobacter excelsi TaxID=2213161 RepID=UPI00110CD24A|nr:YdeI/OmpD-associated family protein [Modestobacter excelsi]